MAEAELSWSKEIRFALLRSRLPCLHKSRKASWGRVGPHPIISVELPPQASAGGSILAKRFACMLGGRSWTGQMWRERQMVPGVETQDGPP